MFRQILEASPSFLHVLRGPDFVFGYADEAYYRLIGRRALLGRPTFEALPEVDRYLGGRTAHQALTAPAPSAARSALSKRPSHGIR
jgi:hypothetical protein